MPGCVPCIRAAVAMLLQLMKRLIISRRIIANRFQISVVSRHRLWHHLVLKLNGILIGMFCQQVTGARRLGGAHHGVVMLKVIKDTFMAPQQLSPFFSKLCQTNELLKICRVWLKYHAEAFR